MKKLVLCGLCLLTLCGCNNNVSKVNNVLKDNGFHYDKVEVFETENHYVVLLYTKVETASGSYRYVEDMFVTYDLENVDGYEWVYSKWVKD